MKYNLLVLGLLFPIITFSQDLVEVTPERQKKLVQEIEKEVPKLKKRLEKASAATIEFAVDTFRIERLLEKSIDLDYSDAGMQNATYEAAKQYDNLLNKYYKKLSVVLKGNDKTTLLQAQKAWLAFRDSETKLVETISKDEYSGGGTLQQLTEASEYLDLIKGRTIALFGHFARATQSE